MSEQDVMRLVAEVVDKSTGVLKKIQGGYKELGEQAGKAHEVGGKAAREHAKHISELQERLNKLKERVSDVLVPAFATLGISVFGVGEMVGTLAEKIKSAGEQYQRLNDTVKRGHASSTFVQGMSEAFSRLGMDASRANDFVAETGETLDKLRRGNAAEMQRLQDTFGNALPWLQKVVAGARNYQEAAERIMKALTDTRIPIDQRRKLAEAFHIDPRIASKNGEEVGEALSKSMAEAVKHGLNIDTLNALDDAYTNLGIAQQHFWNDLINVFGPGAVKSIESVTHAIEYMNELFEKAHKEFQENFGDGNVKMLPHKKPEGFLNKLDDFFGLKPNDSGELWERLKRGLGAQPSSFHGDTLHPGISQIGFSTGGGDRNSPLYRGVRDGVLDAFRQLMGEKPGGAGGFTNASYTSEGGGGGYSSGLSGRWGGYGGGSGGSGVGGSGAGHSPSGGSAGGGGVIPNDAGTGTDAYVGGKVGSLFDRSRFAAELKRNPALRDKIMRIAANEQGSNPAGTQAVLESMMNRAIVRHTSLEAQARWYGKERGGYYAMGNMGRGALENAKHRAILEKSLSNALNNANTIDYATDNSSGGLASRERASGAFVFHRKINGESFFSPGMAEKGWRNRYEALRSQMQQEETAHAGHGAHLSDRIIRNHLKSSSGAAHLGHASVSVDFHNMPRGTRTSAKASGRFKEVKLNRGRPMAMASQDS